MRVHIRGNPETLGDEVAAAVPVDPGSRTSRSRSRDGSGRLELASAIACRDNPLTARVIVNRVWKHHFGRGLVAHAEQLRPLGEPPTHPELLDHLASRFIASGWSLKALHREIMLSAAYQQASDFDADACAVDPDNRLLWRMNRRRLDVEAWRDAILAVAGTLDDSLGGPSLDLADADNRRRTLYARVSRHDLDPLLRLFDFPDPNITSDGRPVTTVPLQQLFVLNSEFMVTQRQSAGRPRAAPPRPTMRARIRQAIELALGRPATDDEVQLGREFLSESPASTDDDSRLSRWEQYAQVLLSTNEFMFVD